MRTIGHLMQIEGLALVALLGLAASGSAVQAQTPTTAAICNYPSTEYSHIEYCRYVCILYSNSSICYPNWKSRHRNSCPAGLINAPAWQPNAIAQVRRLQNGTWLGGGPDDGQISLGKDLNMNCKTMPLPPDYLRHIAP
jgi:hypothetical protein